MYVTTSAAVPEATPAASASSVRPVLVSVLPVYSYTSFRFLSLYTTCLSGLYGVHFALLLPFTDSTFEFAL